MLSNKETDNNIVQLDDSYDSTTTLIGTVHVSKNTRKRVLDTIADMNPDVVAIELDSERLYKMFEGKADINIGDIPPNSMFQDIIKKQQEKMFSDKDGLLKPGDADMFPAANKAMKINSEIALIDMSVDDLKSNIKSNIFKDGKISLEIFNKSSDEIVDSLKLFINSRKDMATRANENGIEGLVEEMENSPLSEVSKQFEPLNNLAPEFVTALIDERDKHMAGKIHWLRQNKKNIIVVMGRGHLLGVQEYLNNPETIPDKYVTEPDWYNYTTIDIN